MALNESSTLVTAKKPAAVKNYAITISSQVNDDEIVVDKQIDAIKDDILKNYDSLKAAFNNISNHFDKARNYVQGEKLKTKLHKLSTACANQAKYCGNRKNSLIAAFRFVPILRKIEELESDSDDNSGSDGTNNTDNTNNTNNGEG